jgi:hypothetical protein
VSGPVAWKLTLNGFAAYDPLWIANYSASGGGTLPNG